MMFPALPEWLPWWAPILILAPGVLWLLAFLLVPFSVIGVKPRLDTVDARLDEIQGEIRALALRLPARGRLPEDDPAEHVPIPPPGPAPARPRRVEPRL